MANINKRKSYTIKEKLSIIKKQQKITDFLKKWLNKFVEYFYGDLLYVLFYVKI